MNNSESIFKFVLREKFLTLTVLGSIFTFAFISSLKGDIIDPLFHFMLPEDHFDFMNVTIREGEKIRMPQRHIEMRFGNFFREFVTWLLVVATLFVLSKYTSFPDTLIGNVSGAAVM